LQLSLRGIGGFAPVEAKRVTIADDAASPAAATVMGRPVAVFLWLWGRVGDDQVTFEGDQGVVAEFRARLVECTG
jgi:MDMPI C-terminal domain